MHLESCIKKYILVRNTSRVIGNVSYNVVLIEVKDILKYLFCTNVSTVEMKSSPTDL